MPTEMLTEKEHRRGEAPPVATAPKKDDTVGAAARSSTGAQPRRHWVHWPNRSVLWLLVGLVVVAAVAVTVDRTVFSGGTSIPTTSSVAPVDSTHRVVADDAAAAVVAKYRERIPELMTEQDVPGLAVALVDKDRTVWLAGFGRLDGRGSAPVNADTIFSVESMSKLFAATAVVQAVAAGRLDLDEPITTYLPGFTVHSAFEEHPERKITLRMLLSHTAGFTHEAPVGNSNELDPGTFDAHVRSISRTWLRFPGQPSRPRAAERSPARTRAARSRRTDCLRSGRTPRLRALRRWTPLPRVRGQPVRGIPSRSPGRPREPRAADARAAPLLLER